MSLSMQPSNTEVSAEVKELLTMLTYKRRHGSQGEKKFFEKFVASLENHPNTTDYREDAFGNAFVEVAGGSTLGFSAHTDSVHSMPKVGESEFQEVLYDAEMQVIYKDDGQPLGADDASGVWLLRRIADAGIPCSLFFFRGEEVGGLGSSWAADKDPEYFEQFDMAIAFDRRGTTDVITHQGGSRCASDEWAQAFSDQLNRLGDGLHYSPCDGGVFTDTANLTDLIPECSNVSTAYFAEHGPSETQDVDHLLRLRDAVLQIDWASLPIKRDPSVPDPDDWRNNYRAGGFSWDYGKTYPSTAKGTKPVTYLPYSGFGLDDEDVDQVDIFAPAVQEEDLYSMTEEEMIQAAEDYPVDFALAVHELIWGKKK